MTAKEMPKKFTLVNWLDEDNFGVMPATAAMINPEELYVGCKTKMKWTKGKKPYDVEILKISCTLILMMFDTCMYMYIWYNDSLSMSTS